MIGLLDEFVVLVEFEELLVFHFHFISEHLLNFFIFLSLSIDQRGDLYLILLFDILEVLNVSVSLSLEELKLVLVELDFGLDKILVVFLEVDRVDLHFPLELFNLIFDCVIFSFKHIIFGHKFSDLLIVLSVLFGKCLRLLFHFLPKLFS